MAYEDMTYEVILDRMLKRVTDNYPNLDIREGSMIYNALAPAAVELAIAYTELDNVLKESFVTTASREYILLACKQIGMDVSAFDAHKGTFKGEFNVQVPIGSRWNCDLYNYTVGEAITSSNDYFAYSMTCETAGTAPNYVTGTLTPITEYVTGLTHAEIVDCLIQGEDETSDDDIRESYFEYQKATAVDGNVEQYKRWCKEYDGIGNCKIFPKWNGANTVKVSILSANNRKASTTLISQFQKYLDPGKTGMGDGVAPIGAVVTVTTATEVPINVSAKITLSDGYTEAPTVDDVLAEYFSDIAYEKTVLSYMSLGAVILSIPGIESISELKLNNGTADISIASESIPVVGTTSITVVS